MADPKQRPSPVREPSPSRITLRPTAPADVDRLVPTLGSDVPIPLGPLESQLLAFVDGRRTVRDLASLLGLAPLEVLRVLERLQGLVPQLGFSTDDLLVLDELWGETPPSDVDTAEFLLPEELRSCGSDLDD